MGSKDFSGAQAISQAYGQALENKGDDITFKDNLGATEIVYKALENGDLDGYADYQGTLLTYLGGDRVVPHYGGGMSTAKAALQMDAKQLAPVDVSAFYVTKDTAKKYKLKSCRPHKSLEAQLRRPARCDVRCASVTRRSSCAA